MLSEHALKTAASILGMSEDSTERLLERMRRETLSDKQFIEELSASAGGSEAERSADWKDDPFSLLVECAAAAKGLGAKVDADIVKNKFVLDFADGPYYVFSGRRNAKQDALMAAWNGAAGDHLQVMRLKYWDQSDTLSFVLLPPAAWDRLREAIGPLFDRIFAECAGKAAFAVQARPKLKKLDWKKEYAKRIPSLYLEFDGAGWNPQQLGENKYGDMRLATCIPPDGAETRQRMRDTFHALSCCEESITGQAGLDNTGPPVPIRRWLIERKTEGMATWLYAQALVAHLRMLWALYYWSYRAQNCVARFPVYLPRISFDKHVVPGAWGWFIFDALDCEAGAKRLAPLLEEKAWDHAYNIGKCRDDGWLALARLLANGTRSSGLAYVDPILPLLDAAAWKDRPTVERALACHMRPQREYSCASDAFTCQCWPAPLYSLGRRAGAEQLLPKDNPFLSMPLNADDIDHDLPVVVKLSQAIDDFAKVERSCFRAYRPNALTPPLEAELRAKTKDLDSDDDVQACRCESIYAIHWKGAPQPKPVISKCEICGYEFWPNRDHTLELLIAGRSDEI